MSKHMTPRRLGLTVAAVMAIAVAAAVSTTGLSPSLAQEQQAGPQIKVGLFNFRQVLEVHPGRTEAEQRMQQLEQQAQQAQQEQDQQAFMQAYQQIQQVQQDYFNQFQEDLGEAMNAVVEESGAQIIAIQIEDVETLTYTAENVETEDVTNLVIREITDGELEEAPAPQPLPGLQQQQPQQQQQQEEAPPLEF